MKKLLLFLALAAAGLQGWADDFYIVGNATNDDWTSENRSNAYKMTKDPSLNKYTWTGFLKSTNGDLFKICIGPSTWEAWCAGSGDKEITISIGETETFTDDGVKKNAHDGYGWNIDDNKWKVKVTGYYTLTLDLDANPKTLTANLLVPADDKDNCSISTSAHLKNFASLVNDKGLLSLNAKLKDDIDMTGESSSYVPIGTDTYNYAGVFDGQGFRIKNLVIDSSTSKQALFRRCGAATIKNLVIDSSCSFRCTATKDYSCAAFVAGCYSESAATLTFENCGNEANVYGADCNSAAFLGFNHGNITVRISNCYNKGNISGGKDNCAFIGWNASQTYTMTNCYNIGVVSDYNGDKNFWGRSGGDKTLTNCYTTGACYALTNLTVNYSSDGVASGELCYKLNGSASGGTNWYQNLSGSTSVDAYPVPFDTHDKVYLYGASAYVSEKSQAEIGDATDLVNFATLVNSGLISLNAKLTANIDMTDQGTSWTPIGKTEASDAENNGTQAYKGTFDGNGYTIDNLVQSTNANKNQGLFGVVNGGCIIENLIIGSGCDFNGSKFVGAFVGSTRGGGWVTIRNCGNEADVTSTGANAAAFIGAVVASGPATRIINCYNKGAITGNKESAIIAGWFGGHSSVKVENFYNIGSITGCEDGKPLYRNGSTSLNTFSNVYHTSAEQGAAQIGEGWEGNGALCYKLNGNSQGGTDWYQTLAGTDTHPYPFNLSPSHRKVYSISATSYTNLPVDGEGDVQISDADDLNTFAAEVNAGNVSMNAELTDDIDMSGVNDYTPIGTSTYNYIGTFNGQGHYVNLNLSKTEDNIGLIAFAGGGATIQNLVVKGTVSGKAYVGGIVGCAKGSGTLAINRCGNEAAVTASAQNAGGLLGCNLSGNVIVEMTNCYNSGAISGNKESAAISGWLGSNPVVTNCYNKGTVTGVDGSGRNFARWNTDEGKRGTYINCYNTLASSGSVSGRTDNYDSQKITSGELCAKLGYAFRQTLGTGYPCFDETLGFVTQIGEAGYSTQYITDSDVTIPDGVEAYAGVINGDEWLHLDPISEKVKASTPVILKLAEGTEAGLFNFMPTTGASAAESNDLQGSTGNVTGGSGIYALAQKGDPAVVGFYPVNSGVKIPEGRAYLEISGESDVKGFTFVFNDDATAIEMVNSQSSMVNEIYNLAGQRIQKMQKGINIVNGKKILK